MQKIYKQFSTGLMKYSLMGAALLYFGNAPVHASVLASVHALVDDQKVQEEDKTVSGTVVAEDGTPMPGVNVLLKGTLSGTTTDLDGNYTLTVPDDDTVLTFSFIGYVTQNVKVGTRSVIEVKMMPDRKSVV